MKDIEILLTGNSIYQLHKAQWDYLYASYTGGDDYRKLNLLTRYEKESDEEYNKRLYSTPIDNQCKSVLSVYSSFIFREEPEREFDSLENLPEIKDFLKDADLDGRSFDNFMKEVQIQSAIFGHTWIIMSKPSLPVTSRAQEQILGLRPYVSLLTPQVVLDWVWERNPIGKYELSYLKYVEDINGDVHTVKEWYPDLIRTSIANVDTEEIQEIIEEPNPLMQIPAVICYSDRSIVRGIGISQINDIADAQKLIYNLTSEAEQSIRLDSHPSIVTTPGVDIGCGAGSVITVDDGSDPALKPYVLDFNGASIDSINKTIDKTVESIDRMANIGGIRVKESREISGVALQTEFQLLNAKLASIAGNLELAEEQLWRLFCIYQMLDYDIEISYPGSFDIKNTDNELQNLQIAAGISQDSRVQAGITARVLELLELDVDEALFMNNPNQIQEVDVSNPQEFEPLVMINPETKEIQNVNTYELQLSLASQGWVEFDD